MTPVIPSSIDGKTVVGIGSSICGPSTHPDRFTFPDTLVYIADYAFNGKDLTEIKIPKSVKSIGDFAFGNAEMLRKVYIYSTDIVIHKDAFSNTWEATGNPWYGKFTLYAYSNVIDQVDPYLSDWHAGGVILSN